MNSNLRKFLVLLLVLAIGAAGCSNARSSKKIMWKQVGTQNGTRATYTTFDGVERTNFTADKGDVLELEVEYTVEKGTLGFKLVSPSGEVMWQNSFQESGSQSFSMVAPESGSYQFQYIGEETGGGFEFAKEISK